MQSYTRTQNGKFNHSNCFRKIRTDFDSYKEINDIYLSTNLKTCHIDIIV